MNSKNSGNLFIISAPSGAGKTSLVKELFKKNNSLVISISHTTRQPRKNEIDGEDYFFVTNETFNNFIKKNYFLEYAKVFDNYYGTSRSSIELQMSKGKNVILEIDWQGAQQVKSTELKIVSIFILPPSYQTLKERLINRKKDNLEIIERRMAAAIEEISHYKEYDFTVINDNFETTLEQLIDIITNPETDLYRQSDYYDDLVNQIMAQKDIIE